MWKYIEENDLSADAEIFTLGKNGDNYTFTGNSGTLKDELLAAQAAQREEIEAQNATKKEYQDRIARNSEEASELNADIEALRGAMRR